MILEKFIASGVLVTVAATSTLVYYFITRNDKSNDVDSDNDQR